MERLLLALDAGHDLLAALATADTAGRRLVGHGTLRGTTTVIPWCLRAPARALGKTPHRPAAAVHEDVRVTSVLVVDDEPGHRRLVRRLLEPAFEVVGEAATGAAAVRAASRLRPDVVVLDVNLPDASGFDVAEALAGADGGPAVILTSPEDLSGPEVERSGARGFLLKAELSGEAVSALLSGTAAGATAPLRVILAEDQVLLREGLARLLGDAPGHGTPGPRGSRRGGRRRPRADEPPRGRDPAARAHPFRDDDAPPAT
jgi:DNA-binding NarL/FixJ family response regulator